MRNTRAVFPEYRLKSLHLHEGMNHFQKTIN